MSDHGLVADALRCALHMMGLVMAVWLVFNLRDAVYASDKKQKNKGGAGIRRRTF